MPFHSVDEGTMKQCVDCHENPASIHTGEIGQMVAAHDRLACQVCHIPAIARQTSTKVEWYWSEAGDLERIPVLDEDGRPDYDPKKGEFVWASDVRPTLRFHNGKWNKTMIAVNDQPAGEPVDLGSPAADRTDPDAMIYPFKRMIGNQVADDENDTVLVPHLFKATDAMPNPYWGVYDWDLALWDAVGYPTGQSYTGEHEFVATQMLLAVNHEIAPKEQSLGVNANCSNCHGGGQIDWPALGWDADPYKDVEADVFLTRILMRKLLRLPVGSETRAKVMVIGDGDGIEQDAKVVLSADAPDGVELEFEPDEVTKAVVPGAPQTRFVFGAEVECKSEGRYLIISTAAIDADKNADPNNDTAQAQTLVVCTSRSNKYTNRAVHE